MGGERDDMAADALADREVMECRECAGLGWMSDERGVDYDCEYCDGLGYWKGRA